MSLVICNQAAHSAEELAECEFYHNYFYLFFVLFWFPKSFQVQIKKSMHLILNHAFVIK